MSFYIVEVEGGFVDRFNIVYKTDKLEDACKKLNITVDHCDDLPVWKGQLVKRITRVKRLNVSYEIYELDENTVNKDSYEVKIYLGREPVTRNKVFDIIKKFCPAECGRVIARIKYLYDIPEMYLITRVFGEYIDSFRIRVDKKEKQND